MWEVREFVQLIWSNLQVGGDVVCFKLLCKASSAPPVMLGVLVGSFLCGILSRMVEWLKEIIFHREESERMFQTLDNEPTNPTIS